MPSQRRVKVFALLATLAVLSFIYLSSASSSTRSSPFYTNTAAALDTKHQEALDLENHLKIQEVHEAAEKEKQAANVRDPDLAAVPGQKVGKDQKPFAVDVEEAAEKAQKVADTVKEGAKDAVHGVVDAAEKSVAGRKMIKGEKGLKDDGVAKVGNTGAQPAQAEHPDESEEEHKVEIELNAILKKSPSTSKSDKSRMQSLTVAHSRHFLQELLPLLEEGQGYSARAIPHRACPLRGRARPSPSRPSTAGSAPEDNRQTHSSQCFDQWQEHRWRR